MKNFYILVSILLLSNSIQGQELSRTILTTAGDFAKNKTGVSIDWTIGEVFSQTVKEDHHITGGFQQGNLKKLVKPIKKTSTTISLPSEIVAKKRNQSSVSFNVYPNPTTDRLTVSLEQSDRPAVSVMIYNELGYLIIQQDINTNQKEVNIEQVSNLSPGVYFLRCTIDNEIIGTKNIVKI